jgi:hypothetical protein
MYREWVVSMEAFATWLCEQEKAVVGFPGRYFDCPVARWLSEVYGQVYGIDGRRCWRASDEMVQFRLPAWVDVFTRLAERWAFCSMTGCEAFMLLACIEERSWRSDRC